MNRWLAVLNFVGVLALAGLCAVQWHGNRRLHLGNAELERTRKTPAVPFIADSMGRVTSASTSSGARPCDSVSTVTVGAVRSGKTSMGIVVVK